MSGGNVEVTITRLELEDPDDIVAPSGALAIEFEIEQTHDPLESQWFYEAIGAEFSWTERLGWSDQQWRARAQDAETWVTRVAGERAGYFELLADGVGSTRITNFGLLAGFRGSGLGGHVLVRALERGFEIGRRVWVSTNTLDGEHALANYQARGMRVFDRTTESRLLGAEH